ncbi:MULTISPECIES: alpha/beta hydrolase [Sorangium]|uniref:Alpha/beta hydrolase n=1 Tax=Sorangium cellulosum TaxID=56 RepID=A0A4P2QRX5_SORCE|nr:MULTISPECIES: alpha/beta fold hydrolase [Sorangium]AUX33057.1 alpha/beta hydrolase [Sorangium cellulosum]WCQ92431.1 esterase/lipase [Sorangium sp. Soce836]
MSIQRTLITSVSSGSGASMLEILTQSPEPPERRPPLLFVHGSFHGAWCWSERFMPYFAERGYRTFAVSLRGHGGSEGSGDLDAYALEDYVDDVGAAAASLEEPPVLVGHSLGGAIVQKYMTRSDRRCRGAVLMASPPPQGASTAAVLCALAHPLVYGRLVAFNAGWSARAPRDLFFSKRMDRAKADACIGRFRRQSRRVFADFKYFHIDAPGEPSLPMLVVCARGDKFLRLTSAHETARFYGGAIRVISGPAHDMMLDDGWQLAAGEIASWLSAVEERGGFDPGPRRADGGQPG